VSLLFGAAGSLNEALIEINQLRAAVNGGTATAAADSNNMRPSAWAHREQKYKTVGD